MSMFVDVRYAVRGMRRAPGLAAVMAASLALGIGANTAIFSLVNALLLRQLPVRHPEELVEMLRRTPLPGEPRLNNYSLADYRFFRDQNHVFSALVAGSGPFPF